MPEGPSSQISAATSALRSTEPERNICSPGRPDPVRQGKTIAFISEACVADDDVDFEPLQGKQRLCLVRRFDDVIATLTKIVGEGCG